MFVGILYGIELAFIFANNSRKLCNLSFNLEEADVVEYALSRNMSSTMISEYKTKLISKEVLREKLEEIYNENSEIKNSQQRCEFSVAR